MCSPINLSLEKRYEEGYEEKKEQDKSETARDDMLQFYNVNKAICDKAYKYYTEYNGNKILYVKESICLTAEEFLSRLKSRKILVLTANPIERGILIRWLSEKNGSALDAYMVGSYSYNVYNVTANDNELSVVHVDPGKTGEDFMRRVINNTCKLFKPDYIIALGICYGFYKRKYHIGYVFLSESLTVFRVNYRDTTGEAIELETEIEFEKQPSHKLVQSVRERLMYTMVQNFLSDELQPLYAQTEVGRFLSINSLISNEKVKQALIEQHGKTKPKPLGGEMEGPGILKSDIVQEQDFLNWLIVKSICDWGEMKNSLDPDEDKNDKIKDSLQAFAMTNTCSVFDKILADLCEV